MNWDELREYIKRNPDLYYPNSATTLQDTVLRIIDLMELKEKEPPKKTKKGET